MNDGLSPQCSAGQHGTCPGYYKTAHMCGCDCHKRGASVAEKAPAVLARAAAPTAAPGLWNREQVEIIRRSVAAGCTDDELAFFAQVCRHKGLDPFAGEIIAVKRYDSRENRKVMVIQETVAGLRALGERSGLYNGQDPPLWCGPDGRWVDVWLDPQNPPAAAKVAVYRKGWDRPTVGIARYASYVQLDKDGRPQGLWRTGADFMLWKCAEAAALKRAFKHALRDVGVPARDLTDAQRLTIEARKAGLDDDARHALVAQVTDGRTSSTRDLDDDEALEFRAEVARIRAEVGADPETGEESAGATTSAAAPPASGHPTPADSPPDDAVTRAIARGADDLERRMALLSGPQIADLKPWRQAQGLARPIGILNTAERARLAKELDRRGWVPLDPPKAEVAEPPEPPPPPDEEPAGMFPEDEPF